MLMDEEDVDETHATTTRKAAPEEFGRRPGSLISGKYFGWTSEGGRSLQVPVWMESLWANNGAGTGVFIPRAVAAATKPRRKRNHRSRKNTTGGRLHSSLVSFDVGDVGVAFLTSG